MLSSIFVNFTMINKFYKIFFILSYIKYSAEQLKLQPIFLDFSFRANMKYQNSDPGDLFFRHFQRRTKCSTQIVDVLRLILWVGNFVTFFANKPPLTKVGLRHRLYLIVNQYVVSDCVRFSLWNQNLQKLAYEY